jgi:hypothetical protein
MTHTTLPKYQCVFIPDIEAGECIMNKNFQENPTSKAKEATAASTNATGNPRKHSATEGSGEQVPK